MSAQSSATRYGAVAISIHWVSAAAVAALLATGLIAADATDPALRTALVQLHLPLGVIVLLLTLLRIVWWWRFDRHPVPPEGQLRWQQRLAGATHYGLYFVLLLLVASGIGTLVLSGALPALLSGAALPDFEGIGPRIVHGIVARLLIGLLILHIGAALYHQFIRRDRLLGRMGVGPV